MSTTERTNFPEAPASATAKVKSKNGFSWLFTIRESSGSELMTKLEAFEEAVLAKSWTPEANMGGGAFPKKPEAPTKPCSYHPGLLLKQKLLQDGKELWSHSRGVYPNLQYCNGQGFPDERGQIQREPYEGNY